MCCPFFPFARAPKGLPAGTISMGTLIHGANQDESGECLHQGLTCHEVVCRSASIRNIFRVAAGFCYRDVLHPDDFLCNRLEPAECTKEKFSGYGLRIKRLSTRARLYSISTTGKLRRCGFNSANSRTPRRPGTLLVLNVLIRRCGWLVGWVTTYGGRLHPYPIGTTFLRGSSQAA